MDVELSGKKENLCLCTRINKLKKKSTTYNLMQSNQTTARTKIIVIESLCFNAQVHKDFFMLNTKYNLAQVSFIIILFYYIVEMNYYLGTRWM